MKKLLPTLKFFLGWPITIIAFFFILKTILTRKDFLAYDLIQFNPVLLALGMLCFFIYYFLRGYLWQKIIGNKGFNVSLRETMFLWELTELRRFVPGNIWSFLSRTVFFSEKKIPSKIIISSLIIEVEFLFLGSLVVSLFATPFVLNYVLNNLPYTQTMIIVSALAILGLVLFIFHGIFTDRINAKPFSIIKHILPNFPKRTIFFLLCISIIFMFFFGLGYYFTISSVLFLSPALIISLVGYFVLSFLFGYLSLVAPMGLGVREGAITFGLSKLTPLSLAGLAAIYSRVILIISELIFFLFTFIWKTTKSKLVQKLEFFVENHKQELVVMLLVVIYIFYFTTASFMRYDNFYTGRFDLGNMDQVVWNTKHGRIFQLTDPDGTEIISRLAIHADFFLVLLTPFYFIWSDPRMLLLIQSVVVAAGAIYVFLLAKMILRNKNYSLIFSLLYLLNPSVQYANLFDFHAVTLATTFLLGAIYYLLRKKYLLFLLLAVLAALTKEQVWTTIAIFGLIIATIGKRKVFGMSVFVICSIIFYLLIWFAIPAARGSNHFALSYYSDFGSSPTGIAKNIILYPSKTFSLLIQPDRLIYLKQLFLPLGFTSVFSPLFLIFTIPDFLINILSNNSQLRQIYFQYTATITPFLFASAIFAVKNIKKILPKLSNSVIYIFLIITTLYSAYEFGPLPGSKNPNIDMFVKQLSYKQEINNFLTSVPKRYSIAATNNLGSHLSRRQRIFTIPIGLEKADIIAFLLNDPFAQPSPAAQKKMVEKFKKDQNYEVLYQLPNDFTVFIKKSNK
ncbi:MAG: DUF2079 domain-containing protein [Candidatus Levybacteria bacterium]|nr:DUF2079 domain-containing protein [Candidatus Levybacteria bacterium]